MKTSSYIFGLGIALVSLVGSQTVAGEFEDLFYDGLPVIGSIDEKDVLPSGFRMTKVVNLPHDAMPDLKGLADLNISGSAQFSELSLNAILKRIGKKHITIVNVRQEDTGFIEPMEGAGAISFGYIMPMPWWTGEDPRGNRTVEEIEISEENRMQQIMKDRTFSIYGTSDSYAPTDTHQLLYRIDIAVKRAFTEKQLAEEKGLGYFRIPDKKFGNMEYEHVDMFVDFVKGLPDDEWVHFHCRRGRSRTTLFMIMYDIMRNAEKVAVEDIVKRQGPLGIGGMDLFGLPSKENWEHSFKKGWKEFLYQFYDYVKATKVDNYAISWSTWAEENNIPKPPPVVLGDFYRNPSVESLLPSEDMIEDTIVLALNSINEDKVRVQNFRSTQDLWLDESVKFEKTGLTDIRASASNQYTYDSMVLLVDKLKKRAPKVVVVDLRHDDHLFVNGLDVSSFDTKEALLLPRTPDEIRASEIELKNMILAQKGIVVHAIDTKYPKNEFDNRYNLTLAPTKVETPEEFITGLGAEYLLVGTKRFSDASDDDLDRFISYMRQMPTDTWYHFHCKKGKSRTTLFMIVFDMMHNADKVSMEQIVKRQYLIGGVNLFDITAKDPEWQEEREFKRNWISFMARFHRYAQLNKDSNFAKSWSEWSAENEDYMPNIDHLVIDNTPKL